MEFAPHSIGMPMQPGAYPSQRARLILSAGIELFGGHIAESSQLPRDTGRGGATARLAAEWQRRPWWMNLLWFFCLYMTFIYLPFDLFIKPVAVDQEVWFGFMLEGWAAKLTAPLHWAIYAAGAYGFWKMRPWMWPWAALYVAQIAVGMGVWSLLDARGGVWTGAISVAVMAVPAIALWRSRHRFVGTSSQFGVHEDLGPSHG